MLVDVTLLRRNGIKLERHELDLPVRGDLVIKPRRGAPLADGTSGSHLVVEAALRDGAGKDALHPLRDVVVTRMAGDTMVLIGTEVHAGTMSSSMQVPQAWACTLVRQ